VQRARPSYNPRGTCPRWARSPAAPGGPIRHNQQFHSTRDGGGSVWSAKCLLRSRSRTRVPHSLVIFLWFASILPFFLLPAFSGFSLIPFSSSLSNLLEVVQRARPSFNPKGTCPRWAESPAAPGGAKPRTRQFHSTIEEEKKTSVRHSGCLTHKSVCRTLLPHSHACFFPCSFFSSLPTSLRSCNGHAPLLIQKGRARAGQEVTPRRVGPCATPNSSLALREGERMFTEDFGRRF
jgi:hypothetical protein